MIEQQTATVYYSPGRGRRFFSFDAAAKAEAHAIISAKYPPDQPEFDVGFGGWEVRMDEARYPKMHRRMTRLVKAAFRCSNKRPEIE